jgi:hypothetical protein
VGAPLLRCLQEWECRINCVVRTIVGSQSFAQNAKDWGTHCMDKESETKNPLVLLEPRA